MNRLLIDVLVPIINFVLILSMKSLRIGLTYAQNSKNVGLLKHVQKRKPPYQNKKTQASK